MTKNTKYPQITLFYFFLEEPPSQCFPESQTRLGRGGFLDLVDQDVSYYKSVRFSLFFLGIEAQKRVLRPFELLVNISAIITENWGLCYKKHKRGWRRIPSKKIVSFLVFLFKETRKPLVSFSLLTRFRLSFGEAMAPLSMGST